MPLTEVFPRLKAVAQDAALPTRVRAELLGVLQYFALWRAELPPQEALDLQDTSLALLRGGQADAYSAACGRGQPMPAAPALVAHSAG